jgi:hypothetical protein
MAAELLNFDDTAGSIPSLDALLAVEAAQFGGGTGGQEDLVSLAASRVLRPAAVAAPTAGFVHIRNSSLPGRSGQLAGRLRRVQASLLSFDDPMAPLDFGGIDLSELQGQPFQQSRGLWAGLSAPQSAAGAAETATRSLPASFISVGLLCTTTSSSSSGGDGKALWRCSPLQYQAFLVLGVHVGFSCQFADEIADLKFGVLCCPAAMRHLS